MTEYRFDEEEPRYPRGRGTIVCYASPASGADPSAVFSEDGGEAVYAGPWNWCVAWAESHDGRWMVFSD